MVLGLRTPGFSCLPWGLGRTWPQAIPGSCGCHSVCCLRRPLVPRSISPSALPATRPTPSPPGSLLSILLFTKHPILAPRPYRSPHSISTASSHQSWRRLSTTLSKEAALYDAVVLGLSSIDEEEDDGIVGKLYGRQSTNSFTLVTHKTVKHQPIHHPLPYRTSIRFHTYILYIHFIKI